MKRKEMERILKQNRFSYIRSNKHIIYSNGIISIALPNRMEYTKGLSRRILQQAGFNKEIVQEILK